MKRLFCLMLVGVLASQDLPIGKSQRPALKTEFKLDYHDLPISDIHNVRGNILVEFFVDRDGNVTEAQVIDTFDIRLNHAIIDKVMSLEFIPAMQNGRAVKIKYSLPIVFK